ncbi:hypothetical protein C1H57_22005 [Clostridium sp. 2-1]|uniref:DUF2971 domain-containing protein n=1 Tax=Clostridium TaxID=1485 RepID=UPI000CDA68FF|nr:MULTISPECIES: DUF2971 domain-containing protein [Clostridium]MBN7572790.1 DUF2971 domain-containing protein [Clostridium beijerinckii]MBN7578130.1 DUF2971 domain-containing protein [Clostridium beijerinckii]MBN7582564.1 DUF2971 domain-containing protein [Clostridium beijerinckii]MBO0521804.1 DUF2971 domain-containing protein [Clostridium beijerinckii]POO89163.1 hypothetical protein C1H57_22005 [Clostridium sp. 2-1]
MKSKKIKTYREKWMEEYEKRIIDHNVSYESIKKYISEYMPKKLYRYRKFDEYLENNLAGEIYFSDPSEFNDPFDSAIEIDYIAYALNYFTNINRRELENLLEKEPQLKKILDNHYNETYRSFKNNIRIACFTTSQKNTLMWSHYAENHSGYCIEYDTKNPLFRDMVLPVIYRGERYDCTPCLTTLSRNISINAIFFKDEVWNYEHEWRAFGTADYFKEHKNPVQFINAISAIYIGAISKQKKFKDVERLQKIAKENGIPVYEMKMLKNEYKLTFDK